MPTTKAILVVDPFWSCGCCLDRFSWLEWGPYLIQFPFKVLSNPKPDVYSEPNVWKSSRIHNCRVILLPWSWTVLEKLTIG